MGVIVCPACQGTGTVNAGPSPTDRTRVTISFTGSHAGLTSVQRKELERLLATLKPTLIVHGACVGADDICDQIAVKLGIPRLIFPGNVAAERIHDDELKYRSPQVTIRAPKAAATRNRDIARNGDMMIACPRPACEIPRSGAWTTVRYARAEGKRVHLVWP